MEQTKETYQLILNNQLLKGFTLEQVLDNLSVLFKKDRTLIREILSRPDFIVKNNVSYEQAKKIQKKLSKAGISSRLHKIQLADSTSDSLHNGAIVSCPKCGTQQIASEECQNCGVVFAKYGNSPVVYEPKKEKKPVLVTRPTKEPWYTKGSNIFVLLIVIVAGSLLLSTLKAGDKEKPAIDPNKVGTLYYDIEEVRFIDDLAEPGYETIVELYADWCKTCDDSAHHEKNYIMKVNPRMAIRRIDISRPNGFVIASEHFRIPIRSVPYIIVFDKDGSIIADDGDGKNSGSNYVWNYRP